jgi:hypothetical protein
MVNPPRLLPLKAAAAYLGLTTWAMREAIWRGLIPFIQYPGGRKLWLDVRDLENFITKNKRVFD